MDIDFKKMVTENRNKDTYNLDEMSSLEIVSIMNKEDYKVPLAISKHLDVISKIVDRAVECLKNNGRIIYIGAGTSGRLAVSDASECPPTFGVDYNTVIGLMAGGEKAFIKAIEGAEDSTDLPRQDLKNINLNKNDIVIGLAASGRTPYVLAGLKYAKEVGASSASISCNENSEISKYADFPLEVVVGEEVLTGSTRLKAGTCQKLILNMISTATMVKMGKVYENLMVDVVQTNEKLEKRAIRIIKEATSCDDMLAKEKLKEANGSCKIAIVMILASCNKDEAISKLKRADGHVKKAIKS